MPEAAIRAVLRAALALVLVVLVLTLALARPDAAAARREPGVDKRTHAMKKRTTKRVSRGLRAVRIANHLTGIPYVWGGASPRTGLDGSGLVQYVYVNLARSLPHYTVSLYQHGWAVARSRLRPGDLVFFYGLGHVGIYAGHGRYIHAPRRGTTVRWASLASNPSYYGARRIVS